MRVIDKTKISDDFFNYFITKTIFLKKIIANFSFIYNTHLYKMGQIYIKKIFLEIFMKNL